MANQFIPSSLLTSSGIVLDPEPAPLTITQEWDSEIIQVLDGTGSCPGCIGGLTYNELLSRLQTAFPMTGWNTQIQLPFRRGETTTLLEIRLRIGLREGRFCRTSATRYGINRNMVIVNPGNAVFIPFSNNIVVPKSMLGTQASVDFVFNGCMPRVNLSNPYYATAVSIVEPQLLSPGFISGIRRN